MALRCAFSIIKSVHGESRLLYFQHEPGEPPEAAAGVDGADSPHKHESGFSLKWSLSPKERTERKESRRLREENEKQKEGRVLQDLEAGFLSSPLEHNTIGAPLVRLSSKERGELLKMQQPVVAKLARQLAALLQKDSPMSAVQGIRRQLYAHLKEADAKDHATSTALFETINDELRTVGYRLITNSTFGFLSIDPLETRT
jgi:hypothetical protein